MSDAVTKYFCPRLLDYIILVGPRAAKSSDGRVSPELGSHHRIPHLLRRFPCSEHSDFPLPPDVVIFCQPEGCERIESALNAYKNPSKSTNSFVFLLTEKDTSRVRYGICLNFYRPLHKLPNTTYQHPSTQDLFAEESSASNKGQCEKEELFRNVNDAEQEDCSNNPEIKTDKDTQESCNDSIHSTDKGTYLASHKYEFRNKSKQEDANTTYALNSLCIISHHPFFSTFRECLFILKNIIEECDKRNIEITSKQSSDVIASKPPLACRCYKKIFRKMHTNKLNHLEVPHLNSCPYSSPIWSLLTMPDLNERLIPNCAINDVVEIETWIHRMLSVPVPVPEKTKIEVEVLPNFFRPPFIFALPDHTRFQLIDFPLHLPLELIGVQTCLKVLICILLENKVAVQSKDYNALSMSVMAFVTMLYPLEYMFPVIPLLPSCMSSAEQLLLAPTPYIIGFPASFFKFKSDFKLPNDVWIVDLDSNQIRKPPGCEDLPPLPDQEGAILTQTLQRILDSIADLNPVDYQTPSSSNKNLTANLSLSQTPKNFPRTSIGDPNSQPLTPSKRRSSIAAAGQLIQLAASKLSDSITNASSRSQSPVSSNRSSFAIQQPVQMKDIQKIQGNDSDSADVATRIAMVRFFNSQDMLANFTEHTRTIRLYPRPVVSFQKSSFIQSRNKPSLFLTKLVETQAVEYLAEWTLSPSNVAFQRVQTGVVDPTVIGDKPKWFGDQLKPLFYRIWNEKKQSHYENMLSFRKEFENRGQLGGRFSDFYDSRLDEIRDDDDSDTEKYQLNENYKLDAHKLNTIDDIHSPYLTSNDSSPCLSSVGEQDGVDLEKKSNSYLSDDSISTESNSGDDSILESIPKYYQHDIGRYPETRCIISKIFNPPKDLVYDTATQTDVDVKIDTLNWKSRSADTSDDESSSTDTHESEEATYNEDEVDLKDEIKLFEQPIGSFPDDNNQDVGNMYSDDKQSSNHQSNNIFSKSLSSSTRDSVVSSVSPARSPLPASVSNLIDNQKKLVSQGMAKFFDRTSSINDSKGSRKSSQQSTGMNSPSVRNSDNIGSFFDRFTSEARDAVKEAKAAYDAGRTALKTTALPAADASRQKLIKNFQNLGEVLKNEKKESSVECATNTEAEISNRQSPQSSNDSGNTDTQTQSLFGGWLGTKATGFANRMRERAKPLNPFPPSKYCSFYYLTSF